MFGKVRLVLSERVARSKATYQEHGAEYTQ